MVAVALELKRRGHRPVLATAEYFRDKISSAGLEFLPLRPNLTPADRELLRQTMDERSGPEYLVRTVMMPALHDTFTDLRQAVHGADVLVATDLLYAAPVVADAVGIPWVAMTMAPMTFLSAYDPPALTSAPWLAQLARFSRPAYAVILRFARWSTRDWGAPVYELRRELGLPRGPEPLFGARANADALLGMFSSLVGAPQPDWPANARIAGFAFYDRHEPMPRPLSDFLDAGDPPIVFTLGSAAVFDPGAFFRHSAEASRRLGRRAVLLVGPDPENIPAADGSLAIASYAPFSELFPRAAAVVHQGGIGTTAQVLRAARPMLIIPFSHDQPDNAARMVRLGVARTIRRGDYSATTAAAALQSLLSDPSYSRKAMAAAVRLRGEDGAARAADVIEAIAGRGRE